MGKGYPALQPTREYGERRKLPSGVRGGAPAEKGVLEYLELEKTHLIATYLVTFTFTIITKT